ncbi:MAG: alpha/beta hydrolase [Planctomycetales bacterium]
MFKQASIATFSLVVLSTTCSSALAQSEEQLKTWLKKYPAADANKDGVLTKQEAIKYRDEQRAKRTNQRNRPQARAVEPTLGNLSYGPHERNVLDLWVADPKKSTPLLICIHGGGFKGGDKKTYHGANHVQPMLDAGISVACINYRLTENGKHPFPAAMNDGARAIQFLRANAKKFNLDKTRFAAKGGSAGGCMLMWLGFHPDLADPNSKDPIERESSRLQVLAPSGGQSTLHLGTMKKWFGVKSLIEHPAFRPLFGLPLQGEIDWDGKLDAKMREASPITYLTQDDPPIYLTYGANKPVTEKSSPGHWVHHPMLGIKLKEAMDKLSIEAHVQYQGGPEIDGYESQTDFIIKQLTK